MIAKVIFREKKLAGGPDEEFRFGVGQTSLGSVLVASGSDGVVAIIIGEDPNPDTLVPVLERRLPGAALLRDDHGMRESVRHVVDFIEAPAGDLDLPLDIRGTPFQLRVWRAVMAIPFGRTTTFSNIAAKVGAPKAVRAIGNACSNNPLELAIPCHRVLHSDGSSSGGSAWGNRRQSTILKREAAALANKPHAAIADDK